MRDGEPAAKFLIDWLEARPEFAAVRAVGHRVVHGMARTEPARITPDVLDELHRATPYAPDHLPREIERVEAQNLHVSWLAHVAHRHGLAIAGTLDELLDQADVVVDCTPKYVAAKNIDGYRRRRLKFIVQGGEKHEATGHSFVAESNYASALNLDATRVVSCNTTSIVRTLTALKRAGLLQRARGALLRRATDPWESHEGGIMNTLVPEPEIPSHQGPDAQSVDPDLDVVTMAVKVPETLGHLHYWSVQLTRHASKDEVLDAFRGSSRIALIHISDGLVALNTVKELMADRGRPHDNLYEVALWADMLRVQGDELFYAYMVDNQAIVIPETVDAIRALTGTLKDANDSIHRTNAALGIEPAFV